MSYTHDDPNISNLSVRQLYEMGYFDITPKVIFTKSGRGSWKPPKLYEEEFVKGSGASRRKGMDHTIMINDKNN